MGGVYDNFRRRKQAQLYVSVQLEKEIISFLIQNQILGIEFEK